MWKSFFDGFSLLHGVFLASAAIASFKFWARSRFRLPTYVHVLALLGALAVLSIFWGKPEELRGKISAFRMIAASLIGPIFVYFFFIAFGGPRAALESRYSSLVPCPFCQTPIRGRSEDRNRATVSLEFAASVCPHCGRNLPQS